MHVSKVGDCGKNLLATEHFLEKKGLNQKIIVLDKSFQKIGTFSLEDAMNKPECIKTILSEYNPIIVENCFKTTGENFLFKFTTETFQGILDATNFTVIIEPTKYDFVYCPNAFDQTIFTVEKNKVQVVLAITKASEDAADSDIRVSALARLLEVSSARAAAVTKLIDGPIAKPDTRIMGRVNMMNGPMTELNAIRARVSSTASTRRTPEKRGRGRATTSF